MKIVNQDGVTISVLPASYPAFVGLEASEEFSEDLKDKYIAHLEQDDVLYIVQHGTGEVLHTFNKPTGPCGVEITNTMLIGKRYLLHSKKGDVVDTRAYVKRDGHLYHHRIANVPMIKNNTIDNYGHTLLAGDEGSEHAFTVTIIVDDYCYGILYSMHSGDYHRCKGHISHWLPKIPTSLKLLMNEQDCGAFTFHNRGRVRYANRDGSFIKSYILPKECQTDFVKAIEYVAQDVLLRTETDRLKRIMSKTLFKSTDMQKLLLDLNLPTLSVFSMLSHAHYYSASEIVSQVKPRTISTVTPVDKAEILVNDLANSYNWSQTHKRKAYRALRRIKLQMIQE